MPDSHKNKALFLDRDGTINVEKNYVWKIEDFEFIHGIFPVIQKYQNNGYLIFIVTNQSGIARGYYTENDFVRLTDWMNSEFRKAGITVTKVYFCPHHPDFTGECNCRKPKPGMILNAIKEFNLDPEKSVLIGDSERDIKAGKRAGIGTNLVVHDIL